MNVEAKDRFEMNDAGNANRFTEQWRDSFCHVDGVGWFRFNGKVWENDGAYRAALAAAEAVALAMKEEADRRADDVLAHWARKSGSLVSLKSMLALAEGKLNRALTAFDADPKVLNVQNGTLHFAQHAERWAVELHSHLAADNLSRICGFRYEPEARCPRWDAHVKRCFPDDDERAFLQRSIGYMALGANPQQVFFIWQGRGGEGKSVTAHVVKKVLNGYAAIADVRSFLRDRRRTGATASPDMARLSGATRFLSTSEPLDGAPLEESLIKWITGGSDTVARHLHEGLFEYTPQYKLLVECNALPRITGSDEGIWRRVSLLTWRRQVSASERNVSIQQEILDEGEGVLAWIVEGALDYLNRAGLEPPPSSVAAHERYRANSDPIGGWVTQCTEHSDDFVSAVGELYESYRAHAAALRLSPVHPNTFAKRLKERGYAICDERTPAGRNALRRGLRLKAEANVGFASQPPALPPTTSP